MSRIFSQLSALLSQATPDRQLSLDDKLSTISILLNDYQITTQDIHYLESKIKITSDDNIKIIYIFAALKHFVNEDVCLYSCTLFIFSSFSINQKDNQ